MQQKSYQPEHLFYSVIFWIVSGGSQKNKKEKISLMLRRKLTWCMVLNKHVLLSIMFFMFMVASTTQHLKECTSF